MYNKFVKNNIILSIKLFKLRFTIIICIVKYSSIVNYNNNKIVFLNMYGF